MKGRAKFQKLFTPRRLKICLAIPCTGTVRIETMMSVVQIMNNTPHDFYFAYRTSCYVELNRTRLIQIAMEQNCEKLFFLDADMIVEANVVNKLLALNKPVVGAAYNGRKLPLYSNVKITDDSGKIISVPYEDMPKAPFKTFGVPTGCMLIDIPTVQKIPRPWFDLTYNEDGTLDYGEDIYFCKILNDNGIEVWCDPTIEIGHIGTFTY
jgi:hypothetical protein